MSEPALDSEWRETGERGVTPHRGLAYAAARLTHESSVVFLPLLVLTGGCTAKGQWRGAIYIASTAFAPSLATAC